MNTFTPEALRAITAEESHWQTIYFNDYHDDGPRQTHIIEKHENDGYTYGVADGTDIGILERLDTVEHREIAPWHALELRNKYSQSWAARRHLRVQAEELWGFGVLQLLELEDDSQALTASFDVSAVSTKASDLTVRITADGAISTELTNPVMLGTLHGKQFEMDWHEYELPRHVPFVYHREKHLDKPHPIEKPVINSRVIVSEVFDWLKLAVKISRNS